LQLWIQVGDNLSHVGEQASNVDRFARWGIDLTIEANESEQFFYQVVEIVEGIVDAHEVAVFFLNVGGALGVVDHKK